MKRAIVVAVAVCTPLLCAGGQARAQQRRPSDARLAAAVRAGRELTRLEPYRESGWRILMQALTAEGNTAEALQAYERLRTLLREELGIAPSAPTQELFRVLLG